MHDNNTSSKILFTFFGPPGSGKGTLAEMCVKQFGFKMLSTGNLLRKHISLGTEFGNMVKGYLDEGKLVPDELVNDMVGDWLKTKSEYGDTIILDGYPRTSGQADKFLTSFKDFAPGYEFKVIYFIISDEAVVKRLAHRFVCQNKNCQAVYPPFASAVEKGICDLCGDKISRRDDDKVEIIKERLKRYPIYKQDVLGYYESVGIPVVNFDVEGKTIEEVFESFKKDIL